MEINVILSCGFFYVSFFFLLSSPPDEPAESPGPRVNWSITGPSLNTLFLNVPSSRLVLSYVNEEPAPPDFCDGHSPAVTITFVCPSERREVSRVPLASRGSREHVWGLGTGYGCRQTGGLLPRVGWAQRARPDAGAQLGGLFSATLRVSTSANRVVVCSSVPGSDSKGSVGRLNRCLL